MKNVFYLIQSLLDSRFLVQSTELGHLIYTTDVNEALAWESALEAKAVERFIRASDPGITAIRVVRVTLVTESRVEEV